MGGQGGELDISLAGGTVSGLMVAEAHLPG